MAAAAAAGAGDGADWLPVRCPGREMPQPQIIHFTRLVPLI